MQPAKLVENETELRALAADLSSVELIALDTEFVRERTYYPRPCLMQLAWDNEVACVDILVAGGIGPLAEVLFDDRVTKVLHAARQDLELIFAMCGQVPAPIYDTQIAGAILGFPDQSGYGPMVEETLGTRLDKGHARTDWTRRPLSDDQLSYAVDDVRYLLPMQAELERRLAALDRQEWPPVLLRCRGREV